MADRDTLAVLAEELGRALQPLSGAVQNPDSFASLMGLLGWDLATIPEAFAGMSPPLRTIADVLEGGTIDAAAAPGLLQAIGSAFSSIDAVGSAGGLPAGLAAEMPRQLVDYLAVEYLLDYQPRIGELLKLIGVIRLTEVAATATRPAFLRRSIAWEDLGRMLDVPGDVFANAYHWGQADFDQITFAQNVADFARAFAIPASFTPLSPGVRAALTQGGGPLTEAHDWMVRTPLLQAEDGDDAIEAGIGMFPLPAAGGAQPGFSLLPYAQGMFEGALDMTEHVSIVLEGSFDVSGGIGLLVRPNQAPQAFIGLETGGTQASGEIGIGVAVHGAADEAVVVAGSKEASRIEFRSVSFMLGMRVASAAKPDVYGELDLQGGRIVIKPSESDGFLAKLLPADGIMIDVALLVGLSSAQGVYFGGSGGLEISLPAHVQLGPIEIVSATLAIKPKTGSIPLEIGATIKGELGPLKAVVENVGMRLDMTFPAGRDGNLGVVNLGLGFKPPNGVGLSIDAGVVKGGGYLFIDPDKGEYAGAIELTFANFLSLKAIGLISTKMPDGSPGFSLLVIITAEFPGGLQLGYGFKLIGVGGLLGLNRTMKLGPLMEGVRTGAIDGIMFPTDIVANAPRIISDLRAIFPPKQGTFLIGPMAKLGWCTPTLISLAIGIIIEIPGNVAIIGVIKIALPTPEEPVVVIQANFAGAIEFDKKRGFFFAALFESRILTMTLEGEMGMLIAVGEDANFVVSVGGFHPDFDAPPLPFPSPKRLALSIIDTDNARIRVEMYFAVTPNTIQFGAGAELYFGFNSFSLQGHFAFDALLTFVPLSFVAQLSASVSLEGLRRGRVLGPAEPDAVGSDAVARARQGQRPAPVLRDLGRLRQDLGHRGRPRARGVRGHPRAARRARKARELARGPARIDQPARVAAADRPGRRRTRAAPARRPAREPVARAARPQDRARRGAAGGRRRSLRAEGGRRRPRAHRGCEREVPGGAVPRPRRRREAVAARIRVPARRHRARRGRRVGHLRTRGRAHRQVRGGRDRHGLPPPQAPVPGVRRRAVHALPAWQQRQPLDPVDAREVRAAAVRDQDRSPPRAVRRRPHARQPARPGRRLCERGRRLRRSRGSHRERRW